MWVAATLHNGIQDIARPSFRTIGFGQSPAQHTVVVLLRHAWTAVTPLDLDPQDDDAARPALGDWMRVNGRPENGYGSRDTLPQNQDKESIDTAWRREILRVYNHLFYDIGNFLPAANCATGHFHPPNHTSFTVAYSPASGADPANVHVFDTNVVLIPAFLDKGVRLKGSAKTESGDELALGVFDADHLTEAWFLRAGLKVEFEPTSEGSDQRGCGIAAVIVVGILCVDDHDHL